MKKLVEKAQLFAMRLLHRLHWPLALALVGATLAAMTLGVGVGVGVGRDTVNHQQAPQAMEV